MVQPAGSFGFIVLLRKWCIILLILRIKNRGKSTKLNYDNVRITYQLESLHCLHTNMAGIYVVLPYIDSSLSV